MEEDNKYYASSVNLEQSDLNLIKAQGRGFNFSEWVRSKVREEFGSNKPQKSAE